MGITDLDPRFVRHATRNGCGYSVTAPTLELAQSVVFLCPTCFAKNGGPIGTHLVIVTFEGTAVSVECAPGPDTVPAYVDKYRGLIEGMGANPEQFGGLYATAIRIRPTRVRVYE